MRGETATCSMKLEFFIEQCPVCAVLFGVPTDHHNRVVASGGSLRLYCLNGHSLSWAKGEADRLKEQLAEERRQRQRAEQRIAMEADGRREAEERAERERRRANGYKGHATRMTKRAKAGVCPCCNRTFQQLARHMATKHPQFTPMALEVIDGGKAGAA